MGVTVVGKPAATVITSSPGRNCRSPSFGLVRAVRANKFAEEPELTINEWRIPIVFANLLSNFSVYGPEVSQKSRLALTAAASSVAPNTFPVTGICVSPGTKFWNGCRSRIATETKESTSGLRWSATKYPLASNFPFPLTQTDICASNRALYC